MLLCRTQAIIRFKEGIGPRLRAQSFGEEIANSIIAGIGAALSITALVLLIVFAAKHRNPYGVVGFSIYGTALILLYLMSTFYHSFTGKRVKRVFKVLDHASIYLLIAGTYTPVVLVTMRIAWGWTLLGAIWFMAVIGIILKSFFSERFKLFSILLYITMGWLVVLALKPMIQMAPAGLLMWLLIGGICYTLGIIFYAWEKIPFHHTIWHLFVLAGSICHFFGMLRHLA